MGNKYTPDQWTLVELKSEEHGSIIKVFAGWYGGYLNGDSWKLSSGVTETKDCGDYYEYLNESGSLYTCYKRARGMSGYMSSIYAGWVKAQSDNNFTIEVIKSEDGE